MNRLRRKAALRFYLRHPAQLLLAVAGIALGVAVVVAVDLANEAALRAFELSRALTASRATHNLQAAVGDLPESAYRRVKVDLGLDLAAPVVEGRLGLADDEDATLVLLGIDPIAELAFDETLRLTRSPGDQAPVDVRPLLLRPGSVLVPLPLAERLGIAAGDELRVIAGGRPQSLEVSAVVELAGGRGSGDSGPLIADISTAQELLGRIGRLSRIELALTASEAERTAAALPAGLTLARVESGEDVTREMLRAFRINLTALSLLALVVGMLLIYATMSFAIVQRRRSLGTLRALGATRQEIARDVLRESVALGVMATVLGLALGWLLSRSLVGLVLATINDLYFTTRVAPQGLSLLPFAKGGLLGVGATVLAALRPAIEAAGEPPRAAMSRAAYELGMRRRFAAGPALSAAAFVAAAALIALPARGLVAAFAGLFLVLAGYALLVPVATARLLTLGQAAGGGRLGLAVRFALRGAAASLSRTGIAVTALAVAVATVVGIGIMIDSFRSSVTAWLDRSLTADYYILTRGGDQDGFAPAEIAELESLPGVAGVSLSRSVDVASAEGVITVRAARAGPRGYSEEVIEGDPVAAFAALDGGAGILLAEPWARRRGLRVGDSLTLPAPGGEVRLAVAGIFRDYRTSDSGAMLPYAVFSEIWGYRPPLGIGIYQSAEHPDEALAARLARFVERRGDTRLVANRDIRRVTLEVFDQTFEITGVLRLLAGIIAFFGILSALLALQLERGREVATLRAIGFTRGQTAVNALAQTTLLGAVAGLLALPLGALLASLLIYVINQRSFGWSMGFELAPGQLVSGVALAVLAATLAGLYPARRLAAQPIAANLRAE